jgi:uncharacterized membrane protein
MTPAQTTPSTIARKGTAILRTLQVLAALTVLELLVQYLSAGQMLGPLHSRTAREIHESGAIVLHVVSGLTAVAAILLWRTRRTSVWPAVLSVAVFVLSFLQAYLGDDETLYLHIPGALVLTVGSVWVLVWSLSPWAARAD